MIKLKNVINKHKSNKIKENSSTVRHLNNGTDHRHWKSMTSMGNISNRLIWMKRISMLSIRAFGDTDIFTEELLLFENIVILSHTLLMFVDITGAPKL